MSEAIDIRTAESGDLERVTDLLGECGLPAGGVEENLGKWFVVAEHEGEFVGVCGIEVSGVFGLLRSLAVSPSWRGRSVGHALVNDRIARARTAGIRTLYLLTIDADRYFDQVGFRRINRDAVPREIKNSLEFSSLCPETAVAMVRDLESDPDSPERSLRN